MHTLSGWSADRGYQLRLPQGHDPARPLPVVVALHGYTHDSDAMRSLTSPDGNPAHPDSLDSLADREGFAVVYPNGTRLGGVLPGRAWNAGGGKHGFAAVANPHVKNGVDDMRYFRDLLADLEGRLSITSVYLAGISNGAAMAHRLATEWGNRFAAVATVAGCNQFAASEGQKPSASIPVLHIHGTEDKIWPFHGGLGLLSVADSMGLWADGKQPFVSALSDPNPGDGTRVVRESYGPRHQLLRVEGGGHAWPGGSQFLPAAIIGTVSRSFKANEAIWEFFKTWEPAPAGGG